MPPLEPGDAPTLPPASGPSPYRPLCPPNPHLLPMPIPPVHPGAIVQNTPLRPWLPPHQDYTVPMPKQGGLTE